jgi:hypothetical protein
MKSKKSELHACESRVCPAYGIMIDHEVLIVNEFEAKYKVLVCPECGLRTFLVLKYHPRFIDEKPTEGGD